ncbi:MAG: hypothetical protein AAFV95_01380 [Bacteroidota bacterium]
MTNCLCKHLLFTGLAFFLAASVWAQPASGEKETDAAAGDPLEQSIAAIKELKDGVLIVRLPSKHRKIEQLTQLLDNDKLSKRKRKRMQKLLDQAIEQRDRDGEGIWDAYTKNYDFSELYFTYDTSTVHLKNGLQSGFFLNAQKEVDPSISLAGRPFYLVGKGKVRERENSPGLDAFVILDKDFKRMKGPFPYYARYKTISVSYTNLVKPGESTRLMAVEAAKTFRNQFGYFYQRHVKKEKQDDSPQQKSTGQ